MYAALWRIIPGPWFVKLFVFLVLIAAVVYALFFHAYPWVMQTYFQTPDVTVGDS